MRYAVSWWVIRRSGAGVPSSGRWPSRLREPAGAGPPSPRGRARPPRASLLCANRLRDCLGFACVACISLPQRLTRCPRAAVASNPPLPIALQPLSRFGVTARAVFSRIVLPATSYPTSYICFLTLAAFPTHFRETDLAALTRLFPPKYGWWTPGDLAGRPAWGRAPRGRGTRLATVVLAPQVSDSAPVPDHACPSAAATRPVQAVTPACFAGVVSHAGKGMVRELAGRHVSRPVDL